MTLSIQKFITGPIENNTYLLMDQNASALLIDPSKGCTEIIDFCNNRSVSIKAILLTHGHFDHFMGLDEICTVFPDATVWIHPVDREFLVDKEKNGSYLIGIPYAYTGVTADLSVGTHSLDGFTFEIVHVPGHTPGGVSIIFKDGDTVHCFSGDSLFAGSIGRSDFLGGDGDLLIQSIREKLLCLPDDTIIYPGHGGRTTIGREKRLNPFLQNLE